MKKKQYSLFIGRYSPPHQGHKTIIDKVIAEGKNVVIAIRDTNIDKDNPYTTEQRRKRMRKLFPIKKYKDKVKIITIPDIIEVCYGRKVGWGIREIKVSKEIEKISATKIRNAKNK